jgi:hypothetical protein
VLFNPSLLEIVVAAARQRHMIEIENLPVC